MFSRRPRRTPPRRYDDLYGPHRQATRFTPLCVESLEERCLLAIGYANLGAQLATRLSDIQTSLNAGLDQASLVPFLNSQLDNLAEVQFVQKTGQAIQTGVQNLASNATRAQVQSAIGAAMGSLLGDTNGNGVAGESADVMIPTLAASQIKIDILVRQDATDLDLQQQTFGIGLPGLPLEFVTAGGIHLDLSSQYWLSFTFTSANVLTLTPKNLPGTTHELELHTTAWLENFDAQATIGFLSAKVTDVGDNASADPLQHTDLNLSFGVGDLVTGPPTVSLAGSAHANLMIQAGPGVNFPSIGTTLVLNWDFNANSPAPDARFQDVQVGLGAVLSQMLAPLVNVVQATTEPLLPVIQFLKADIPGLSELWDLFQQPDSGVTILDLAKVAVQNGLIPSPYGELVSLATLLVDLTDLIDQIGGSADGLVINFHDFDLESLAGGKDLRTLSPLAGSATDLNTPTLQPDFQFVGFSNGFDFSEVGGLIQGSGLPGASALADQLTYLESKLDDGVKYSFPLLDDPAMGVVSLLLGNDVDLFHFFVDFNLNAAVPADLPAIVLPFGLEATVTGSLDVHAHFEAGYDTHGIRSFLKELLDNNNLDLALMLDGFYLSSNTVFDGSGTIAVEANESAVVFEVGGGGAVGGALHLGIIQDPPVVADGKVHLYSELGGCLFEASGSLDASLYLYAEIGIGPISHREEFEIAGGTIFSFGTSCIVNPFQAPNPVQLAGLAATPDLVVPFDPTDSPVKRFVVTQDQGELTLNMGANSVYRHVETGNDVGETFILTPGSPPAGANLPPGDVVTVSAFGYSETYYGVKKIIALAGAGADRIEVQEGIKADVELRGEAGSDSLSYLGAGSSLLVGGDGDDQLRAPQGTPGVAASLQGGDGNDDLEGGLGANELIGGNGNDLLLGGPGTNVMQGLAGQDRLVAGPQGDWMDGGGGDDQIAAGEGDDTIFGNRGNDQVAWEPGDGNPRVDGGSGTDTFSLLGSQQTDQFVLNTAAPASGFEVVWNVDLGEPSLERQVLAASVERHDAQGRGGADVVTLNEVTNSSIQHIYVDTGDLLDLDNAVDHVTMNATAGPDLLHMITESVVIQPPPNPRDPPLFGGLTRILLFPHYFVHIANVLDDLDVLSFGGEDQMTIESFTGPTNLDTGNQSDVIAVRPDTPGDMLAALHIEAGSGYNRLEVDESAGQQAGNLVLSAAEVHGTLLPWGATFVASGGDFSQGVRLAGTSFADQFDLRATLPAVETLVEGRGGADIFNVASDAPLNLGALDTIQGTLAIDGGGAANQLRVSDRGASSGNQGVRILENKILGLAGASDTTEIHYVATGGVFSTLEIQGSNAGALSERYRITKPNAALGLSLNDGQSQVVVTATSHPAALVGGPKADAFSLGNVAHRLDEIQAPVVIVGQGGADSLAMDDTGTNTDQKFTLAADSVKRSGAATVTYSGLESMRLRGGAGADKLEVQGMDVTVLVRVSGGLGDDRLLGPATSNVWHVTSANAGKLNGQLRFDSLENLVGGSADDAFKLAAGASLGGEVLGAGGSDTLDYSAFLSTVFVDLANLDATGMAGFGNIQTVIGGSGVDQLLGTNPATVWQVTAANAGLINTLPLGPVSFQSFENLRGGTGPDTFYFVASATLAGSLNGGLGANRLDYSQYNMGVLVDLGGSTAQNVAGAVLNIRDLVGTPQADVLIGDGASNRIWGGSGNDILLGQDGTDEIFGQHGLDILMGGAADDKLDGGSGEDILIAGTTSHDGDLGALLLLRGTWKQTNLTYDQRITKLRNGVGPNGSIRLDSSTVADDLVSDVLAGGVSALDWFWANVATDTLSDLDQPSPERVN